MSCHGPARQSLRRVLQQAGYAVLPAHDCREAVALFLANSVSLVLLDLRAPVLHGLATFKLLTACNPRLPFLLTVDPLIDLSAFDLNPHRVTLERPFRAGALLHILQHVLRQTVKPESKAALGSFTRTFDHSPSHTP